MGGREIERGGAGRQRETETERDRDGTERLSIQGTFVKYKVARKLPLPVQDATSVYLDIAEVPQHPLLHGDQIRWVGIDGDASETSLETTW